MITELARSLEDYDPVIRLTFDSYCLYLSLFTEQATEHGRQNNILLYTHGEREANFMHNGCKVPRYCKIDTYLSLSIS